MILNQNRREVLQEKPKKHKEEQILSGGKKIDRTRHLVTLILELLDKDLKITEGSRGKDENYAFITEGFFVCLFLVCLTDRNKEKSNGNKKHDTKSISFCQGQQ